MKLTNYTRNAFVTSVMNDVPSVDYTELIRAEAVRVAVEALPPKVQALWKDKKLREYIQQYDCWLGRSVQVRLPCRDRDEVEAVVEPAVAELLLKHGEQRRRLNELEQKLRGVTRSATTCKTLAEALPEFAKYLPTEAEKTANLPALANVVTAFVQAGWPKDKAVETAA